MLQYIITCSGLAYLNSKYRSSQTEYAQVFPYEQFTCLQFTVVLVCGIRTQVIRWRYRSTDNFINGATGGCLIRQCGLLTTEMTSARGALSDRPLVCTTWLLHCNRGMLIAFRYTLKTRFQEFICASVLSYYLFLLMSYLKYYYHCKDSKSHSIESRDWYLKWSFSCLYPFKV
jgi:hypothetical protein